MNNRGYVFSRNSIKNMMDIDLALLDVCYKAIYIANSRKMYCPDFGISSGYRTIAEQVELYQIGRTWHALGGYSVIGKTVTNVDGIEKVSNHQKRLAIDFFAYVDGKANYEDGNIALIATCFLEAATDMGVDIDWGGSWKSISDGAHIELVRG